MLYIHVVCVTKYIIVISLVFYCAAAAAVVPLVGCLNNGDSTIRRQALYLLQHSSCKGGKSGGRITIQVTPCWHTRNHHDRLCTYQWYHLLHSSQAIMLCCEVMYVHWPHFQSSFIISTIKRKAELHHLLYLYMGIPCA